MKYIHNSQVSPSIFENIIEMMKCEKSAMEYVKTNGLILKYASELIKNDINIA